MCPNLLCGMMAMVGVTTVGTASLASYKPELAPDLFRYQSSITRSSRQFKPYAWLQYDSQFRLKLASNESMKWCDTDTELIATWLSADAVRNKATCYTCGSPEQLSHGKAHKKPLGCAAQYATQQGTLHMTIHNCHRILSHLL